MSILLKVLAVLSAIGGVLGFLAGSSHSESVIFLVGGAVSGAFLGGFAAILDMLQQILARTPEIPGKVESTWVPMMADWRVGSISVAGGGYHAMLQNKDEAPRYLESEGTRRLFQTRGGAHQEAEVFLRSQKQE